MSLNAPATATSIPAARTGTAPAAVRTAGLRKTYGGGDNAVHALDGVDVDFAAGQFTAVMGPSGSGKSTLMHVTAGLDTATSGTVWVGDTDLTTLKEKQLTRLRRDRVGFVFQQFNLLPTLTAAENIALPMRLAGRTPDQAWLDRVVEVVGLGDRLHHRPSELSGGQQQRVAVARALVARPEVVFADEPTGNLDSRSGARGAVLPAPLGRRERPDDRHGHPRPRRRQPRRPRHLPRRRPGRRRAWPSPRRSECSTT